MYEVIISKAVSKQLKKVPIKDQLDIVDKIESLADDPKPSGVKALKGRLSPYYRVRCGNYRIVYSIEDDKLVVVVVKIGHRENIYQ